MKLRKLLLSLSLAGLCISQAPAQEFPDQMMAQRPAARHIGDGVRSIGDTNRMVSTSPDRRPDSFVPDASLASATIENSIIAPTACGTGPCDTDCDITCATSCCPSGALGWFSAETLLWFSEGHTGPVLTQLPAFGVVGTTQNVQLFGSEIGTGLLPGYRLSGGMFLNDAQTMAVGGRVFGLFGNSQTTTANGNGMTSLVPGVALPTFQTSTASTNLDMVTADLSLHFLIAESKDFRVDFLGGYTYSFLDSSLNLSTISIDPPGNIAPDGTLTHTDNIGTSHQFHGGHIGIESTVHQNRLSVTTLAKLSFGNMRQSVATSGQNVLVPTAGPPNVTSPGGLFATNGGFTNNVFSFIPELNFKFGYDYSDNVRLTAGYSFILWESVAMPGDQIVPSLPVSQATAIVDESFWMQGLDLGAVVSF